MEQRRETAFPQAGILPAPYHGNRYSIAEPLLKSKEFFALYLYFFGILPLYSSTSPSRLLRSRNAAGIRYTAREASMEIS